MSWLSVPGLARSNLDCGWLSLQVVWLCMSSGHLIPLQFCIDELKRAIWIERQCGPMPGPSTASRGVERWIVSLRESRASHSAQTESDEESTTLGGSGLPFGEYLVKFDQASSSWKTAQTSFLTPSKSSSPTFPKSGGMQNGMCFQREPAERHTAVEGRFFWPTPNASDAHCGPDGRLYFLTAAIKMQTSIPTPVASDDIRGSDKSAPDPRRGRRLITVARQMDTPPGERVVGGKLNPPWVEWVMGFPMGWTGLEPLETVSFQQWLLAHSSRSLEDWMT